MVHADENSVLVIEDDQNTASLVTLYLEREGFPAQHSLFAGGDREER